LPLVQIVDIRFKNILMVNGYISFLKLVISCSQNRELIFCKNNEANPQKRGKTSAETANICSFMRNKLNEKQQI
jgi:hypothetical protein